MALNYWKIQGGASSYNPVSSSTSVKLPFNIGRFILRFTARSLNGGTLRHVDSGINIEIITTLTNEFKQYEVLFDRKVEDGQNSCYLNYQGTATDAEVKDIELVVAPLGQATVNGIDGFESGKWNLHTNATVIDDETLELNADGSYQGSSYYFDCKPNTTYTANIEKIENSNFYYNVETIDKSDSRLGWYTFKRDVFTFKTESNAVRARIILTCDNVGVYSFKRPQLTLGTQTVPYEKKRGDRMVMPVARKNLIDNISPSYNIVSGSPTLENMDDGVRYSATGFSYVDSYDIKLRSGSPYKLSCVVNVLEGEGRIVVVDDSGWIVDNGSNLTGLNNNVELNYTPSDRSKVRIRLYSRVTNGENLIEYTNLQLEQNTIATPYEPYAVQMNKNANMLKEWEYVLLDGNLNWTHGANYTGYKQVNISRNEFPNIKADTAFSNGHVVVDEKGSYLIEDSLNNGAGYFNTHNTAHTSFALSVSNEDTGFVDGVTPTAQDWKDFFFSKPYKLVYKLNTPITTTSKFKYPEVFKDYRPKNKNRTGLFLDGKTGNVGIPTPNNYGIKGSVEVTFKDLEYSNGSYLVGGNSNVRTYISINSSGNVLTFGKGDPYSSYNINVVNDGEWHTAKLEWDSGAFNAYFDNELVASNISFSNTSNGDTLRVGSHTGGSGNSKSTVKEVILTDENDVKYVYDFTQPIETSVYNGGDPSNLLPSFDSGEWNNISSNAKVYGHDVLVHKSNTVWEKNHITIPLTIGDTYKISLGGSGKGKLYLRYGTSASGTVFKGMSESENYEFTATDSSLVVSLETPTVDTFTFQAPRLIKVPNNTATVNGGVEPQVKRAKRNLFAKR